MAALRSRLGSELGWTIESTGVQIPTWEGTIFRGGEEAAYCKV